MPEVYLRTLDGVLALEHSHLAEKFPKRLRPSGMSLIVQKLKQKILDAFYADSQSDTLPGVLEEVRTLAGLLYEKPLDWDSIKDRQATTFFLTDHIQYLMTSVNLQDTFDIAVDILYRCGCPLREEWGYQQLSPKDDSLPTDLFKPWASGVIDCTPRPRKAV